MIPAKTFHIEVRRDDNGVELERAGGVFPQPHPYLSLMIGDHIFSGALRFRVIERTWSRSVEIDHILRIEVVPDDAGARSNAGAMQRLRALAAEMRDAGFGSHEVSDRWATTLSAIADELATKLPP
jgi:hypothetical protein